ncbi:unnamed protein product [Peniophora sp. CBMAI 1063]|nr:unnamed protein product [Peniophora sp. CBMAI 1063]
MSPCWSDEESSDDTSSDESPSAGMDVDTTTAPLGTSGAAVGAITDVDNTSAVAGQEGLGDINVKDELMKAFNASKKTFKGTYATLQKYETMPNPLLDIDGLGVFGMPLSAAESQRLRSRCNPAAFGKGERTVLDPSVRDTFELDASCVRFLNPAWEVWLREAMQSACNELGLAGRSPRHELYKLLVYEVGSHFHLHQDTEKAPGMFATVVIVLPSQHEGGSVHVQHGRQRKTLQSSGQGLLTTTVMAWYTDVFHEVKPVTGGYRVALTYNLMHDPSMPDIPRAPADDGVFDQIQEALQLWHVKELLGQKRPKRLIHALSHHYSEVNLSFSHLKGPDATLVSLLRDAASMHGFYVALGHLSYTEKGYGNDNGPPSDSEEEEEDPGMCEVTKTRLTLQLKSGFNGADIGRDKKISNKSKKNDDLMMDDEYWDRQEPDDTEYEGYMGNGAGSLEYFYHRTVVAIWPLSHNASLISSAGGRDFIISELEHCTSTEPSPVELSYIPIALTAGTSDVSCLIAGLAIRWKDRQMWLNALKACKGDRNIAVLGTSRVLTALEVFGFAGIQEALDLVVSNTMSTKSRLDFVNALEKDNVHRSDVARIPAKWFDDKRRYILASLRYPQDEDVAAMVNTVVAFPDGIAILRDTLLPQLVALHLLYDWWFEFVSQLQAWVESQGTFSGWKGPVFNAAKTTFSQAVQHAPSNQARFKLLADLEGLWVSYEDAQTWVLETRKSAVHDLCQPAPGDAALLMTFVRTEPHYLETVLIPTLARMQYVEEFWLDLLEQLRSYSEEANQLLPSQWDQQVSDLLRIPLSRARAKTTSNSEAFRLIERFYAICDSLDPMIVMLCEQKRDVLRSMKRPKEDDIPLLLDVLKLDQEFALSQFSSRLGAFRLDLALWSGFVHGVRARAADWTQSSWTQEQIQRLLTLLVTEAVSTIPLPIANALTTGVAQPVKSLFTVTVQALLTLCAETDNIAVCSSVFRKVFAASSSADTVKSHILPLVPVVIAFAKGRGLTIEQNPFDKFFRETIRLYVTLILGKRPSPADSERWRKSLCSTCLCYDCKAVNALIVSPQQEIMWASGQKRRKHVEREINTKKGLKISTSSGGYPHKLVVTKLVHEYDPVSLWTEKAKAGAAFLKTFGEDDILQRLYASAPGRLSILMDCLRGNASPSSLGGSEYAEQATITSVLATPLTATDSAPAGTSSVPRKRPPPLPNPEDVIEISD